MPTRLPREIQAALAQFMSEAGLGPRELLEAVSDAISGDETKPEPGPEPTESVAATLRRVERGLGLSGGADAKPTPTDAATAALMKRHNLTPAKIRLLKDVHSPAEYRRAMKGGE